MAEHLITGYAGVGHVTSADAGLFNAGVCGSGRYVLESTGQFPYTLENNNEIKIGSGDLVDQGRHITIAPNTDVALSIDNGSQGKTRIDVVAMRYQKNTSTGVETAALVLLKGTEVASGSTPTPASVTSGNIFNGAAIDDTPLYYITIDNLQVTNVRKVFTLMPSITNMLNKVYPVGAIYMSMNNTSPATLFGGTWEEIQGKFLLGRNTAHAAGSTGGEETHKLTSNEMPAHTHNGPSHTHTGPSHTHTGPSHTHTIASHTHTASTASAGAHIHRVNRAKLAATGTAKYAIQDSSVEDPTTITKGTSSAGEHTHSVTVKGSGQLTTAASGTGSTGASGTGNTGASGTGATSSTGGGAAHNNMPPYLTVYMWKRTA